MGKEGACPNFWLVPRNLLEILRKTAKPSVKVTGSPEPETSLLRSGATRLTFRSWTLGLPKDRRQKEESLNNRTWDAEDHKYLK